MIPAANTSKPVASQLPARVLVLGCPVYEGFPDYTDTWISDVLSTEFRVVYVDDLTALSSLPALENFSAVWLSGDNRFFFDAPAWMSDLLAWVNGGGGLVTSQWFLYGAAVQGFGNWAGWQAIQPIASDGTDSYGVFTELDVTVPAHPTMQGITSPLVLTHSGTYSPSGMLDGLSLQNAGTTVATHKSGGSSYPGVSVCSAGSGRSVFWNLSYDDIPRPAPSTQEGLLMRNMVRWAARLA